MRAGQSSVGVVGLTVKTLFILCLSPSFRAQDVVETAPGIVSVIDCDAPVPGNEASTPSLGENRVNEGRTTPFRAAIKAGYQRRLTDEDDSLWRTERVLHPRSRVVRIASSAFPLLHLSHFRDTYFSFIHVSGFCWYLPVLCYSIGRCTTVLGHQSGGTDVAPGLVRRPTSR
jgi:hypothetical protein